ncbi:DUF4249 domain-containing protein [uncultured Duncaniella sp.]|uniref:DUF4249 domain-containing protein n=1 Tax=uncultured Duncaniella sp. TaxID=2768039 RepID=UPI0025CF7ED7|nr:DUF4249 domain-containing protein [uncultured Duncaniella sp.]
MAILKYIIPIVSVFLLTGCYEDFNPEIDTKPVLCLNSLITAGEPIEVEVTHTWMFNDEKSKMNHDVKDAVVTIFANERIVDSDYLPKEGDKIRIVAESPTYGMAIAEVVVPYATPIGKVKVFPVVTDIWKGDKDLFHYEMLADVTFNLNIEMDVNDPEGTDNYYHFGYNWSGRATDGSPTLSIGQFEYNSEPIFKEHIGVFETVMGNDEDTNFVFFSDRQFSGRTYTLHLNFSNNVFRVKSQEYDESWLECGVNLYLTTVSKSYYSWAVYKWNVDEGITGDLSDIGLAESKWGYSNVTTGAGVVAAQSSAKYTIELKEFLKTTLNNK